MTDFERIITIYSRFAERARNNFDENKAHVRGFVEALRVDYWYEGLKLRTGIDTAYALELHFEKDSFHRNGDGTIRHYRNKWASYEKNIITPQAKTLAQVETLAPGSTHELNHPLWAVMSLFENKKPI